MIQSLYNRIEAKCNSNYLILDAHMYKTNNALPIFRLYERCDHIKDSTKEHLKSPDEFTYD